jgi:hypothetical protein
VGEIATVGSNDGVIGWEGGTIQISVVHDLSICWV